MIKLTDDTLDKIRKDRELKTKLLVIMKVSDRMLQNYINENSKRFTELDVINALVDHFQVPVSELIYGGKLSKLLSR